MQTDNEFKIIKQQIHVGGISCDLAKAFDSMNQKILLANLMFL